MHDSKLKQLASEICADTRSRSGCPDPIEYHEAFAKRAKELGETGDEELGRQLRLLADVFSMYFKFVPEGPFGPLGVFGNKRTFLPEDLTQEALSELEGLASVCEDPVFVARLADVIWVRAKKHEFARKAVHAYAASVDQGTKSWVTRRDYLKRASQISMQLGRKSLELKAIKTKIETLFEESKGNCFNRDFGYWPAALAEMLIENRLVSDWKKLGDECFGIAKGFPIQPGCDEPRRYYELTAACYERAGLTAKAHEARLAIGEHWESEAALFSDGFQISYRIEQAIDAYRKAGGEKARIAKLMAQLRRANKVAITQMKPLAIPMDVEPLIAAALKAMSGKTGIAALVAFVGLHGPASYAEARASSLRQRKEHPLQALIGAKIMVSEGNVAARVPGMEEDEEASLRAMIVRAYNLRQDLIGATVLEEARRILASTETGAWQDAVRELVPASVFVPDDRLKIYDRALIAGVMGDGMLFAHLIIPQLENSLRHVYQQTGLQITSIDSQDVQEERDLNQLLRDDAAESVLGKDLLWEMRSFLIEKTGPNLRNRLSHGLLGSEEFSRPTTNILLWLVMSLLFRYVPQNPSE